MLAPGRDWVTPGKDRVAMGKTKIQTRKENRMKNFHSTVSRRQFMKALGLTGAGLGAAAAAAPVFRDLDEFASSPNAQLCHSWWVKEVDKPTVEIDWGILEPWDWNYGPNKGYNTRFATFPEPPTGVTQWKADRDAVTAFLQKQAGEVAQYPEVNSVRTRAIAQGGGFASFGQGLVPTDFMGYDVTTPDDLDMPKWTGTLEENARTVRAALHLYGFVNVGFLELDENIKKLFYPTRTRFEDVDEPYRDGYVDVIPNKCRWLIVGAVAKSHEMSRRYGKYSGRAYGYSWRTICGHRAQMFVKALGYHCLTGGMNVPLGVMAGTCELGRISHAIHPERGARIVINVIFATDLPLPPTKPIDAGLFRFCWACKKCASYCSEFTTGNLSMADEPTYEITGPWNRVGIKTFPNNWQREGFCAALCTRVCPFNSKDKASIHSVVSAIVATTPVLNGFFATMDDVFGYGEEADMAEWWDRDLRTYPYDVVISGDNR